MDALMVMNTEETRAEATGITDVIADLISRARATGGVVAFVSAPVAPGAPELPESVFEVGDDLGLVSESADAFDGVDDLAAGLHDLAVDRIIIGGVDVQEAIRHTAMAALACNFDVIVLADGTRDLSGTPVEWLSDAEESGAMIKDVADVWLRM
ncbi:nicotinamidase-related amidase [Brevibacterium pityocampae]